MTALLIFGPFVLIPYIMAHLFNREDYSKRWLTYIFSGMACLGYSVLYDLISAHFSPHSNQPRCHFPLFLFPIFFSPFLILLQFIFNKAIIKPVKYEDDDNDDK